MKRRGRPPHPDVLTPREWDVLTLVREGLTNPQIAERLGISFDAAKYHVAEILSKLGLESREEAAAWQPEPPERPALRPVWARALSGWPVIARIGLAASAAAVLVGLGVLLYGVARSNDDSGDALLGTTTATRTVTASPSPTGRPVIPIGAPMDLPSDLTLLMQIGGGETQLKGLVRVTRSADGTVHRYVLFFAGTHTYVNSDGSLRQVDDFHANGVIVPTPVPGSSEKADASVRPYIAAYGASADDSKLAVALCVRGLCGGGAATIPSDAILYNSIDGGITWSETEHLTDTGYIQVMGVDPTGRTLVGLTSPGSKAENFFWEPGHSPLTPPAQAGTLARPEIIPDGRLVWESDAWYFDDGSVAATKPAVQPNGLSTTFPSYVDAQSGNLLAKYSMPPGVEDIAASLGKGIYIGIIGSDAISGAPANGSYVPAWIDAVTPVVRPIASPFLDGDADHDFIYIAGAYPQATYARVTGASPCAEVHATPDAASPLLACLANDVLVIDLISSDKLVVDTPIPGWRDILTLDRLHGYIDSAHLVVQ
jgi:DNA-binding CsgD family transcriptional regulator